MPKLDTRTLRWLVVLGLILIVILNPGGLTYTLNIIQSVVIIVLGIVATMYLWKRL